MTRRQLFATMLTPLLAKFKVKPFLKPGDKLGVNFVSTADYFVTQSGSPYINRAVLYNLTIPKEFLIKPGPISNKPFRIPLQISKIDYENKTVTLNSNISPKGNPST